MKHVDMRRLPAAMQEERRRQVIGLRRAGMAYDTIAAQVGLTRTGVFDISDVCRQLLSARRYHLRRACEGLQRMAVAQCRKQGC
jgi:methionine salvage enolase-phosphatase E1